VRRARTSAVWLAVALIASLAIGCRPAGDVYSCIQFHGLDIRLLRTTMTIRAGDGSADARRMMNAQRYAGSCGVDRITVRYPEGCEETAHRVARAFAETANLVATRLGIQWSFALEIRLVRAQEGISGFHYAERLTPGRKLVFPLFLNSSGQARADWAPVVAHEITEASLLAPLEKRSMALGDVFGNGACISLETRWFRDGVSERAGYMLGSQLFPGAYYPNASGYRQLAGVRRDILKWNNCEGAPNRYGAAAALVLHAENAVGEDAIARVMAELAAERIHGGRAVRRAFSRATGLELPGYLDDYSAPWLGVEAADSRPDGSNPPLVLPGNEAVVTMVHERSPAWRWKLAVGDVVVSADGTPVGSASHLGHLIAEHKAGERIELAVRRGDQTRTLRVKLTSYISEKSLGRVSP